MRLSFFSRLFKYGSVAIVIAAGFLLFAPQAVFAQGTDNLATTGAASGLSTTDIRLTIASIIRTFLTVLGIIAVCICIYGGFVWMTAGGEAEKVDKAKKILLNGAIGLAIILLSYAITSFVIAALLGATGTGTGGGPGGDGGGGPGLDGGGTSSFVVSGFRPEGTVAIRNVQVSITFSKPLSGVSVTPTSVRVKDSTGTPVLGDITFSNKRILFTPQASCPAPYETRFCFAENATYTVEVTTSIVSSTGTPLDCSAASCTSSFTTGTEIDTENPHADLTYPDSGTHVSVNSSTPVQVEGTDDSEIAIADFAIDDVNFDTVVASGTDLTDVFMSSTWYTDGLTEGQRYTVSATVTDIAGNTDTDQTTVRITAASCHDDVLNGDETAVDCGGSCGACEGDACTTGDDCVSGYCDAATSTCVDLPVITSVTPPSGAPGTFVTISGTGFGSVRGTVAFTSAAGTVEADLPACSDGWSDTAIVVEVPTTAVDGPITVTTNNGLSDATNDAIGMSIADFDVNDVEHPNLCRLSPSSGKSGTTVTLSGTNFGAERGSSTVTFGSNETGTYSSWSDTRATLIAPTAEAATYAVGMTVGGVASNTVSFEMTETEVDHPVISYVTPESGGVGQYVTIVGSGFGGFVGSVFFISTDDVWTLASVDFPAECADHYWSENQITVIVPEGLNPASYTIEVQTHSGEYSNAVDFTVDTSDPTPGICYINPESGVSGASVDVYGEHLGTSGSVSFYNGVSASVATDAWGSSHVATTVPSGAATGPVQVTVGSLASNTVNFEIADGSSSETAASGSGYAWMFYTGELPDVPDVYVECSDTRISGVPNNTFTSGGVCVNAEVFAEFDAIMDETTFVDQSSVLIEECTDLSCTTTTPIPGERILSWSTSQTSLAWLPDVAYNGGVFKTSTTYRVTLTIDLATPAPNAAHLAKDVSWKFTTSATAQPCTVDEVRVSPREDTLTNVYETDEFNALPVTGCVILDASSYAWNWSVDDSYASIVEGACVETTGDSCAVVTAEAEGVTDVTAAVSRGTEQGSGTLTINFTDPYVEQVWPDCDTACLEGEVGAQFNTAMDPATVTKDGNTLLYECANELCLSVRQVSSTAVCSNGDCSQIYLSNPGLTKGTYYKAVITGAVESTSGVALTRPNNGADYVWTFKTKDDDTACSVARVEIDPSETVLRYIGAQQTYTVDAFGAPDACSETGQHLSTTPYNWAWQDPIQNDAGVAEWYKLSGSLLDNNASGVQTGCTASCLPGGSTPYEAVCGDGVIGTGEDCDDGNATPGDGCSISCLREGSDGSYGTCGNRTTEQKAADAIHANGGGEDCDDGNTVSGDGCSATCTDEGARSIGVTCGNADIGHDDTRGGEDCDDGNRRSGDGCSSDCVNEGTPLSTVAVVCGDGIIDSHYESCDDSNTTDGDGCSSTCLREGSAARYSAFTVRLNSDGSKAHCGDGYLDQNSATQAGEDCDDSTDEGCSETCTWKGSSLSYSEPSVCGDGQIGIGEVAACESSGGDGNTDAAQVAFISSGAGNYVDLSTHLATATVHVDEDGVTDDASLYLSCVASADRDCPDVDGVSYGVNSSQCCEERPTVALSPDGANVCRNAAIYGTFSKEMAVDSFTQHRCAATQAECATSADCESGDTCEQTAAAYVSFDPITTSCPAGYETVPPLFAQLHESWFARLWHHVRGWFTGEADAASSHCYLPITGISQIALSDGTYKVEFKYRQELEANTLYTIHVTGDTVGDDVFLGVKSASGVPMDGDAEETFTTGSDICTLDQVDVQDGDTDSPELFSTEGETHTFTATPYSYSTGVRQQITGITDVYDWVWRDWQEDSGGNIVSLNDDNETAASFNAVSDGEATVIAAATITADVTSKTMHCETTTTTSCTKAADCPSDELCVGKTVNGTDDVTVLLCGNPWPNPESATFPLIDDATSTVSGIEKGIGWMNFSTYYCRDVGEDQRYCHDGSGYTGAVCTTSDDCATGESCRVYADTSDDFEGLTVVRAPSSGTSSVVKEYLLQYGDRSGDAIGVRVVKNESYLSPSAWYQSQGFSGSPTSTTVDGIEAVRDGRTVYVASPNVYNGEIFPNLYVISYDEGASDAVVNIFNQIVSHFSFLTNVDDVNLCYDGGTYTSQTCTSDLDCDAGETCGSDKDKLGRDMERLIDLTDLQADIAQYGITTQYCSETSNQACSTDVDCPSGESCTASVPVLESGSYVRAMSTSSWPSWTANLGDAFRENAMPTDPLNAYAGCGTSPYASYDAATCVNQSTGSYVCPEGSHVLHYRSMGAFDYQLGAELEYSDDAWAFAIDDDGSADGIDIQVGGAASGSATGFMTSAAFCDASVYGSSNTCGDGIVGTQAGADGVAGTRDDVSEECEVGDTSSQSCTTTDGVAGTIRTVCNADCLAYSVSSTASCVPNECGDGVIQTGETCDDGSLNGQYGYCGNDCTYNTSFTCGDGSVAGPEACDCGSSTISGRTYGGDVCSSHLNGAYDRDPNATCSWDCSGPASYCGDGAIDSGEVCDGNTDSYDGMLCRSGRLQGQPCTTSAQCSGGVCGSGGMAIYDWADSCESSTVCTAGSSLGEACVTDADCDTTVGEGDGVCSDAVYDLARVKTCQDDGADGDACTWNETNWKNIACTSENNCGNGTLDSGEECDDGNDVGTDSCTTACTTNVCGDGYLYSGSEECDEGSDNGTSCTSAYGSSCTYCSTDCHTVASTGSFCGDGVIEGDEYCDAGDIPMQYYSSTYHAVYSTCSTLGATTTVSEGSSAYNGDINEDGDASDSFSFTCADIGVCNGGDNNGQYCSSSSNCTNGECVFATCAADCGSTCPTTFSSEEVLIQEGGVLGADPESSATLQSYVSSSGASAFLVTGNVGYAYVPACSAVQSIALDIDDTERIYPDVYVMFVLDLSLSMDGVLSGSCSASGASCTSDAECRSGTCETRTRLEVLTDAVTEAAQTLYDAYDSLDATMHIGYVAYYGGHGADGSDTDTVISYDDTSPPGEYTDFVELSPTSDQTTLTNSLTSVLGTLSSSREAGTPIFAGILEADNELIHSASGDAKRYIIAFTDGNVQNRDYASLGEYTTLLKDSDGNGSIEEDEYLKGVTNITSLMTETNRAEIFTAVLSSDSCEQRQMARWSSMDCTESTRSVCSGRTSEGNVSCTTRENGVTYAYSATTASELEAMYEQIVNSILNVTFTLTAGGESLSTTVPAGNNQTLDLPSGFSCDGTEQPLTVKASFNGSGTIELSGIQANMCVAP